MYFMLSINDIPQSFDYTYLFKLDSVYEGGYNEQMKHQTRLPDSELIPGMMLVLWLGGNE